MAYSKTNILLLAQQAPGKIPSHVNKRGFGCFFFLLFLVFKLDFQKSCNSPLWTPQCAKDWRVDYIRSQLVPAGKKGSKGQRASCSAAFSLCCLLKLLHPINLQALCLSRGLAISHCLILFFGKTDKEVVPRDLFFEDGVSGNRNFLGC